MKLPRSVVFIDTETTGLDRLRHGIFELALIVNPADAWVEHEFWFPVGLQHADQAALRLNRFYARMPNGYDPSGEMALARQNGEEWKAMSVESAACLVGELTTGRVLTGIVPSFDEERLESWLRRQGFAPAWDHHMIDVPTVVATMLKVVPPVAMSDLSVSLGLDPGLFDVHTALGDARWAMACFEEVIREW